MSNVLGRPAIFRSSTIHSKKADGHGLRASTAAKVAASLAITRSVSPSAPASQLSRPRPGAAAPRSS